MIVLGIDGGGTKTHALALDDHGQIVGSGAGGPSGYHVVGLDSAMATLGAVSRQALGELTPDFIAYCLADCDSEADEQRLNAALTILNLSPKFICLNDGFAALRAGSRFAYGVTVICGTGFNACGISPDGQTAKLTSLGPLTGDWGGGYDLGEAALGAVYRAYDGRGEPTALTEPVLQALDMPTLAALTEQITLNQLTRHQVSMLAPVVFETAEAGDTVAQAIIKLLATEITISGSAIIRRLGMETLDCDLVLSGGLTHGRGSLLLDTIKAQVAALYPSVQIRRNTVPPVIGAALLACDALHLPTPDTAALVLPPHLALASFPTSHSK